MTTFFYFILVFGSIIFFHEFGHFITAKLSGVLVNEFSLGMGPKLFKFKGKETTYSLGIFPIGGYIKMEGEDEESDHNKSFSSKSAFKRFMIIFAGPVMNFVLAFLIFFLLFIFIGSPTTIVGEILTGLPAESSNLTTGDRIIKVNNDNINEWSDIVESVIESTGPLQLLVERDNVEMQIAITPVIDEGRNVIGIAPSIKRSAFYSIGMAFDQVWLVSTSIFSFLSDLLRGHPLEGEVVGPIGIISMVNEASKYSFISVLSLAAVISINLGIVNLLPLPALDGGRLVFILIEIIKGSPVDSKKEGFVHFAGFVFLMVLMVYMVIKDLGRLQLF
jgi:regulator of sigma E protease